MQDAIYRMQQAFDELLDNFPSNIAMKLALRFIVFPLGRRCCAPSDALSHEVSQLMLAPGEARDRLTGGIYVPTTDNEPLADLEAALNCALESEPVEGKLRAAIKTGKIEAKGDEMITEALDKNIITIIEAASLKKMEDLRRRVIMVDDFPADLSEASVSAPPDTTKSSFFQSAAMKEIAASDLFAEGKTSNKKEKMTV